jgi:hypothetical protein
MNSELTALSPLDFCSELLPPDIEEKYLVLTVLEDIEQLLILKNSFF